MFSPFLPRQLLGYELEEERNNIIFSPLDQFFSYFSYFVVRNLERKIRCFRGETNQTISIFLRGGGGNKSPLSTKI